MIIEINDELFLKVKNFINKTKGRVVKIFFILVLTINLFAENDLEKERKLELQRYTKVLNIENLSEDCKVSIKDIIKKTIEYNTSFDDFLINKNSINYKIASDKLKNAKKYFITICTKKDLELIKRRMQSN